MNWLKRLFKKEVPEPEAHADKPKVAEPQNQLLLKSQPNAGDMELNLGMSISTHVDDQMNVHVYISSLVVTSANDRARVMLEMIDDQTLALMVSSLCTAAALYSKQELSKKQFLKREVPKTESGNGNGPTGLLN